MGELCISPCCIIYVVISLDNKHSNFIFVYEITSTSDLQVQALMQLQVIYKYMVALLF